MQRTPPDRPDRSNRPEQPSRSNQPIKRTQRKLSLPLYLVALLVTALIFGLGMYVSGLVDQGKEESLQKELNTVQEQVSSIQLLLLMEDSSGLCPPYEQELMQLDKETDRIGYKLAYLEETGEVVNVELKKSYFVLETQAYLLSQKLKEKCSKNYPIILYFYRNDEWGTSCDGCQAQGEVLLELKRGNPEIRIYSFDANLGSPIVKALESQFNISTYPSLVVNGKNQSGFRSFDQIVEIIKK